MEGGAKVLVTAVGIHSQTGIIMSLLGATDTKEKEKKKSEDKNNTNSNSLLTNMQYVIFDLTVFCTVNIHALKSFTNQITLQYGNI